MSKLQLPDPVPAEAGKALSFPIGMASPLWMAYAGAAAAGAAFWWMSRWTRATNLEALAGPPAEAPEAAIAVVEEAAQAVESMTAEAVAEAAPLVEPMSDGVLPGLLPEPAVEAAPEPAPEATIEAAPEPEPAPDPEPAAVLADDLTRIVGIGPKLSVALAERGLTTFAKLAALEAADLDALDKDMDLKGRAVRDAWVAQAARFAQIH